MSSIHVLSQLAGEPRIRLVPEPSLDERTAEELAASRQEILAHPDLFDGPLLLLLEVTPTQLLGYQGSYAHYRTIQRLGPETALGLGAASVGLCISDGQGSELWVKRASNVNDPDSWSYAVEGGVSDGAAGFRAAILQEALEELGLQPEQLRDLSPRVLLANEQGDAAYLSFSASLAPGAEIRLQEDEAVAYRWVQRPLLELEVSPRIRDLYLSVRSYLPW